MENFVIQLTASFHRIHQHPIDSLQPAVEASGFFPAGIKAISKNFHFSIKSFYSGSTEKKVEF